MLKKLFFSLTLLLATTYVSAQTVVINESVGWLESAFVKWDPVAGADSYNVYYTGGGQTDKKIDTQLIRNYGTYFRADVLGLAAGAYTLKVTAVTGAVEGPATVTASLTVIAHDRTGFAFQGGHLPGGYNFDGTPKTNAVILYITKNTKNTITYDIVTSTKGTTTNYVGLQNILYGIKKGFDKRPFIFRLIGNITDMTVMEGGDITIENAQNPDCSLTIEGVGTDAVVNGMGIRLKSATNIEVRNLGFMNCNSTAGDNIGMQQDNDHIWIHNNDLFYGDAGSDADQIKGDGALDNKNSTYCTFSYNHFWDNGKASLLGLSEGKTTDLYITYHHNWFDHSDSRHPRVRFYSAHIYNNYFDGNSKYGSGSTKGSSLFVENNYFRNAKHPMMTSMQGTDIWNPSTQKNDPKNQGTFSSEDGGTIKAFNNFFDADIATNDMRYVKYGDTNPLYNIAGEISSTTDFDAYEVTNREDLVPNTVVSKQGGNTHNNFDTDPTFYVKNLVPDSPVVAKTKVMQYAGRVDGGDLKWTFDNAFDDKATAVKELLGGDKVIPALKAALTNYTSKLVVVQGEIIVPGNQTLVSTSKNNNQIVSTGVAISNIVFTWGGDATDANVIGLPNGVTAAKNLTAKTITLSGIPTESTDYTITTSGPIGDSASDSGTITVMPPSTQVLTCTSNNNNQTITIGSAIASIVFTWSGDAIDADVSLLPNGVIAAKDATAKTITISGTPTSTGTSSYTVTTSGSVDIPVAQSGVITVNTVPTGNAIHNFTTSGKISTFYTFGATQNMNSTAGSTTYDGLTLTARFKIESATTITYTTTAVSTLYLVLDPGYTGNLKLNGVSSPSADANGVITVKDIPAGTYVISKGNTSTNNLYYIKTSYATLGLSQNVSSSKSALYPNPVSNQLFISSADQKIENVTIYSLSGAVVKTVSNVIESLDVSNLSAGSYLVKITTDQGVTTQKIIKK